MSVAIFPGRFEPFHNGHLLVVQGMVKTGNRVIIPICRDPKIKHVFTEEEVREMISSALLAEDILDADIVVVEDMSTDAQWVDRILEAAGRPADAVVWSGNEAVRKICEENHVATKKIVPVPGIDTHEIRKWIEAGDEKWRDKVPDDVAQIIRRRFAS
ncbi:MAG: adenylyltransferase/cytidyltransferase family protein [Patescibacteria group bacterium]|jgi:nicotinamide-nucleotide adenylyltransferase